MSKSKNGGLDQYGAGPLEQQKFGTAGLKGLTQYTIRFGAGSIDGLGMLSGMTTYSMTLLKGKCWARLLRVGKGWSYFTIDR